ATSSPSQALACLRACVCACLRVCVLACVRACVFACVPPSAPRGAPGTLSAALLRCSVGTALSVWRRRHPRARTGQRRRTGLRRAEADRRDAATPADTWRVLARSLEH